MGLERITARADLVNLADQLRVRPDWHENDEVGVTATIHGQDFDNAGHWGCDDIPEDASYLELSVKLYKDGTPIAEVNLATLFAWATGLECPQ